MDKSSFLIYLDYEEQFNLLTDEQIGQLMRAIIKYEKTREIPNLDGMLKMAFSFIKTQLDRDRNKYEAKCEKNKENGAKGGRPKKDSITTINGAEIPEGEIEGKHFLYFIYDKKTGLHKIGETKNLKQRRYDIKKPTNDLIIIDYYLGTMFECQKYENEILEKYKKYSAGGDWFNLPEEKAKEILTKYFLKPSGYLENHSVSKKADKDKEEDKDNEDEEDIKKKKQKKNFQKPTVEEIKKYCFERKNNINPQQFYDYYQSNGWKVGKNAMKDWQATIRTWEQRNKSDTKKSILEDWLNE